MYDFAKKEGLIAQKYLFDYGEIRIQKDECKRKGYEIQEFRQLTKTSQNWASKTNKTFSNYDEVFYYRNILHDFLLLMGRCGFRTSECMKLRWSDIQMNNDSSKSVSIQIRKENTKVRTARKITQTGIDKIFDRVKSYSRFTDREDFVFSHYSDPNTSIRYKLYENYKLLKEFTKGTIAENAPIIPISAQQGVNIDKLLEELTKIEIPKRNESADPIFLVARSFDINKPGTLIPNLKGGVLGGILKTGKLKVGDEIEIKPGLSIKKNNQFTYKPLTTKILSLHKGTESVKEVLPGASISIETNLDPFMAKTDSLTGCVVSIKGKLPEITTKLKIKYELFKEVLGSEKHEDVKELKTKEMLMLSVNTTITVGIVEKISKDEVELSLNIPIVGLKGDNVGLARSIDRHWRLIGFGEIL